MNAKTLFICLTILAVLSCSAQGLMMNNQKSLSHKARVFAHETVQKVLNHHMFSHASDMPDSVEQDLENFIKGDKQIMAELQKGRISKASAIKIQNFFLNNQKFINDMVTAFNQDPDFPQCFKDLKQSQKVKFVKIIIKSMDFEKILNGQDSQLTDNDLAQIKNAINNDRELGPSVLKCLNGHIEFP